MKVREDTCTIYRRINDCVPETNRATEGVGVDHQPVRVSWSDMKGRG